MKRIHIVGVSPRTGTTLMAELMKNCFDIDVASDHEDRLFKRPRGNYKIYLSKCPRDILIAGPSLTVDPDLYVICMLRDPRDIICSKHKKAPGTYWTGLRFWDTYTSELNKISNHPRSLVVRYETLVKDPDGVQQTISTQFPFLTKTNDFSSYHQVSSVSSSSADALNGVRPISSNSVGRWRNHRERVAGQLKQYPNLSDDLIDYGFEEDNRWIDELDGVTPDLTSVHHSGRMSFFERRARAVGKYAEAAKRIIEQLIGTRIRIIHPKKWLGTIQHFSII